MSITQIIQELQCSKAIKYAQKCRCAECEESIRRINAQKKIKESKSNSQTLAQRCGQIVFQFIIPITRDLLELLTPFFLSKFPYCIYASIIAAIFSYDFGSIFMITINCVICVCYPVSNYSIYIH
eukprot:464294_1